MSKNLLLAICFLCLTQTLGFGQAFKKHDLIFTGGFGGSAGWLYKNWRNSYITNYNTVDAEISVGYTFPFTAEFALHNKWGVGLSFSQNGYINTSTDKSTSNNFGVFGAFHFVSKEKIELYTRLTMGFSRLTYKESEDYSFYNYDTDTYYRQSDVEYQMNGGFVKPSFGLRIFFTEHVGIFADGGIGGYFLSTNKYTTDTGTYTLNGDKIKITMVGVEITGGVAFKL